MITHISFYAQKYTSILAGKPIQNESAMSEVKDVGFPNRVTNQK